MDIAFIAPPYLSEYICPLGTALMGLAHQILQCDEHASQLRCLGRSRYLIVDNSLMELGKSVSTEELLAAAYRVLADEIVLPDVFQNCAATLDILKQILPLQNGLTDYAPRLMAVPQGKTVGEWLECYDTIYEKYVLSGLVQTIGVPKVLATYGEYEVGRISTLLIVEAEYPERALEHSWHLLGVWNFGPNSMDEPARIAARFPWVRSVDTSLPVYKALCCGERPDDWDTLTIDALGRGRLLAIIEECVETLEAVRR